MKTGRTLSVCESDCESFGRRRRFGIIGCNFPDPTSVWSNVGLQSHFGRDCWPQIRLDRQVVCEMNVLRWFAQTLRVLSRRITSRTFLVSLCSNNRTSPVPRSFHSEEDGSKRNNLARLNNKVGSEMRDRTDWEDVQYILKRTLSSSSPVFVATFSVTWKTGSKCGSFSSS